MFCKTIFAQQTCDCEQEFLFVKNYMERNYAGFADKIVNANKQTEYDAFSKEMQQKTKDVTQTGYCRFYIQNWLNYFNDKHVYLMPNPKKKATFVPETIMLSSEKIDELRKKTQDDIEGIYFSSSKNYEIALIKSPTNFRDYAGVIINSQNKNWTAGMVKLELKQTAENNFEGILYYADYSPNFQKYEIKNGAFSNGDYLKENAKTEKPQGFEPYNDIETSNTVAAYRDVNDSTAYIRIKSFDDHFAKKIKSVVKANEKKLKTKPYLIIDLRYNGGGSDFSYSPLMPYIYTQPIKKVGVDVYATPDNAQAWQRVIDDNPKLPKSVRNDISDIVAKMKEKPNQMVNIFEDHTDTLQTFYPTTKKVVILIDEDCGSSTEQFLIEARQSSKVILAGHHTMGVLDYSNVRMVDFECMPLTLGYSTTRSRRIPNEAIDGKGVQPNVILDFNSKEWFNEVLTILKQK